MKRIILTLALIYGSTPTQIKRTFPHALTFDLVWPHSRDTNRLLIEKKSEDTEGGWPNLFKDVNLHTISVLLLASVSLKCSPGRGHSPPRRRRHDNMLDWASIELATAKRNTTTKRLGFKTTKAEVNSLLSWRNRCLLRHWNGKLHQNLQNHPTRRTSRSFIWFDCYF